MNEIAIHCPGCGKMFSATYSEMEAWSFFCPKCRDGVKPAVAAHDVIEKSEEE